MDSFPTPPRRSLSQRMDALAQANEIRRLRAADKAQIKSRALDARSLMADPPEYWKTAHIADLLRALPGVGITKIERILKTEHVSPSRTLSGLTEAQVDRLSDAIAKYCKA